jgi:methane/ammonia monooxygenase subunit B
MRTLQWYDVNWSTTDMKVNGDLVVTGKFRVFGDWPQNLPDPKLAFLSSGGPGSVMVKKESYINGVPGMQSTALQRGRDYEFKLVLQARIPGRWHIHPTVMVQDAGPLVGPGKWIDVAGAASDFAYPVKTLDGRTIPDLSTWGVRTVVVWQLIWVAIGAFWLLWWVRRPMLIPRFREVAAGRIDKIITRQDVIAGAVVLVATVTLVVAGVNWAEAQYPRSVPLQAGRSITDPLPLADSDVSAKVVRAVYDVPGRSMKMTLLVKNNTPDVLEIGEFSSANVRFINPNSQKALDGVDKSYPPELVNHGLLVKDQKPLQPGETREIEIEATDAAWEVERLTSLLNDPDNRFGALIFFYSPDGVRRIAEISGPIVPNFIS